MNNNKPDTQTFMPPDGGFTEAQVAEYSELKLTETEYFKLQNKNLA